MSAQSAFAAALLDPTLAVPADLCTCNGSDPARRFGVYRNNVLHSLTEALADTFPVTRALVGEEFFRAMAQVFVRAQPPRSPMLVEYGQPFADFVQGFAPAASLPYLADVARLEMARVQACHAADAEPITTQRLAYVMGEPERVGERVVDLHPSLQVLRSLHPVVALWAAHQEPEVDLGRVDWREAQTALVLRTGWDVVVVGVDTPTAEFISQLMHGATLLAAAPQGLDLTAALALLLRHGAITEIR